MIDGYFTKHENMTWLFIWISVLCILQYYKIFAFLNSLNKALWNLLI